MNHVITILDLVKVGGVALAILIPLGIIFYILAVIGKGMSR